MRIVNQPGNLSAILTRASELLASFDGKRANKRLFILVASLRLVERTQRWRTAGGACTRGAIANAESVRSLYCWSLDFPDWLARRYSEGPLLLSFYGLPAEGLSPSLLLCPSLHLPLLSLRSLKGCSFSWPTPKIIG